MSHREEQFISFLEKETALFLDREAARPVGVFFSITKVVINQSGERAEIYISIFPDNQATAIFRELKQYEKETRAHMAELLRRRKIPQLLFVRDTTQESSLRLEKLLDESSQKEK